MKKIGILLLLIYSINGSAQSYKYTISSNNYNIGYLSVNRVINNDIMQIEVVSEVKTKIFIAIDFKYKLNCTYKNNELIFSSVTTYVNNSVHSTTITEKKGDSYIITKDGHVLKYMNRISFSGALLYFEEPINVSKIFSEFDGIAKPISKIGENSFQVINPKNKRLSEYIYKDGDLIRTTNHHNLMSFTLTKK